MLTNAHRSLLLGALALFRLAAPARAAEVARIDGARLDARDDRGGDFCLQLRTGHGFSGGGSGTCGRAPVRPRRSRLTAWGLGGAAVHGGRRPRLDHPGRGRAGYSGRYAGHVRFLLVEAAVDPARLPPMLDAAGTASGRLPVLDTEAQPDERAGRPVRLAGGRGWRVTVARYRYGSCLELALGRGAPECGNSIGGLEHGAFAAVGCSRRVAVLTGLLSRRTARCTRSCAAAACCGRGSCRSRAGSGAAGPGSSRCRAGRG